MAAITVYPSTSEHSSPSQHSSQADDPLFLHHGEIGENYPAWACSIKKDLISKNKVGFINGTLTLSSPMVKTLSQIQAWIQANNMVGTWITNAVSPRIQAGIIYMDTALEIWNDLTEIFS
ncbi:hypothetical protein RGQ29_031624 [Quercus rubra]|uniref:Retrotransposon Copia-like N-terminal domain-containing protein n=1 Tax=Quercus rubra TaxID=3512 RepID=A0AAN7IC87_QUERU|nr:hypothetical protein RGQ29_031624 [Quercus rubra]